VLAGSSSVNSNRKKKEEGSRSPMHALADDTPVIPTTLKVSRIVCGVDFSPMSVTAFLAAADLARSLDADLHVLHVIEAYPDASKWLPEAGPDAAHSLQQEATAAMDALLTRWAEALDAVRVTTEISTGLASAELLNHVRDSRRDLIVVGAKGATLLEDAVFGSTAEQIVKEAPCSVLVVRTQPRP
jgi:universal stress protein A